MANTTRKPLKERLFVQVVEVDKTPTFVDVTSALGKPVAFANPLATCAVRVTSDAVFFSMLKLSKRTKTTFLTYPLAVPSGPLAKLERKLDAVDTGANPTRILASIVADKNTYDAVFDLHTDSSGIATVTGVVDEDGELDPDMFVFDLPRTPLQITLFIPGVKDRVVSVAWSGYLNRPDTKETLTRAVALTLNHMCGLNYFQILTGIMTVKVPAPVGKFTVATPRRSAKDRVVVDVPVYLWPDGTAQTPLEGVVTVEVDLDQASPTTNRLMLHTAPGESIATEFEPYRSAFDLAVHEHIVTAFGVDEIDDLVCDIVLGDISDGQLERLKHAPDALRHGLHVSTAKAVLIQDPSPAGV